MGVFSVIAMSLMILISIVLLISSFAGNPIEYTINELTSYFRGLAPRHLERGTDFYVGVIADYSVWSIAWAGIIGKFMVSLSKGRTLRTTVLSTVLIPTLVCWTYIFISRYAFGFNQAKYDLLANWPVIGLLYIVMISLMFTTSADSTAYSIDQEISRGQKATSNYRKLLWVVVIMVFSTTLLLIGGNTGDALYALDYIACPILALLCIVGLCMGFYSQLKDHDWNSLIDKLKFRNFLHKE
jgi:choline-glycine betaine transporter